MQKPGRWSAANRRRCERNDAGQLLKRRRSGTMPLSLEGERMMKVIRSAGFLTAVCLLLSLSAVAQDAPDKAYAQKIWSGWATMNSDNQTQFYASGPHVFFDDEPLKYDNWEDYRKTTAK